MADDLPRHPPPSDPAAHAGPAPASRGAGGADSASLRRIFLGAAGPVLPRAASLLLDRHGPKEGAGRPDRADLRDVLVAVPGGRAGRRLLELLLDEAESRGLHLLPPDVTTVGRLPERLYRPDHPPPDQVLDRMAWTHALRGLPSDEREILFGADLPDDDPAWPRLARTLRSLHRTVGGGGWSFEEVAEVCREHPFFSDEARWRALARVQEGYRETLARCGRMDRELARRRALSERSVAVDRTVWVVGAVEMAPVVRRFLLEAARLGSVTVLVPASEAEADRFDETGAVRPGAWSPADVPDAAEGVRVVQGPPEQADALVDFIASLEGRFSPEEITVGAPDPALVPYLTERLASEGVPVRDLPGRPMERTASFRLLEAAADYLEAREHGAFAALVRHPWVGAALRARLPEEAPPSLARLCDHYHGRHLPSRVDRDLPSGGERKGEPLAPWMRRTRDALHALLGDLTDGKPRTLQAWAQSVRELFVSVHGDELLDPSRGQDRETLEAAKRVRQVLEGQQSLPGFLDAPVPAHAALRALLEDVRESGAIPPPAEDGAVEVLGWLELALDDAPVLVVAGVNEPHVPEAITADPFLPDSLRTRLGLLDNEGRRARDVVHLRLILESRAHRLVTAARRDGEGNPLRLSRLLLGGSPEELARRLEAFLGDGAEPRPPAPEIDGAPALPGFRLPPEPEIRAPAPPGAISVTAFRTLLTDPYLYALNHVLELGAEDDRAREMDGLLFGTLAHEVLERWGRGAARDSSDEEEIREALYAIVEDRARARFGSRPLPAVELQLGQLRSRLGGFARWQAGWREDGWEVREVEARPAGEGVAFEVDGEPIHLRGRIDRVDHHPERGEWILLDYKTGEGTDDPERTHRRGPKGGKRWVDLQLPLYRHLARALRDADGGPLIPPDDLARLSLGYVALPRERDGVRLLAADWSEEELVEADEAARGAIRLLRENVFRFEERTTRLRPGDPLAPVLGRGVLGPAEDEGDDDGG